MIKKPKYYWCFTCERAFLVEDVSQREKVRCPFCVDKQEALDWHSFQFGLGSNGNYPDQPELGAYYPVDPLL